MDLPEITEVKRVQLRPGDRLVVRVDRRLSDDQFEDLRQHFRRTLDEVFGPGVKALLLEPGMDLEVLSAEPPDPGGA